MKKVYIALLGASIAYTHATAQQPVKLSLDDCIAYALKNNYSVRNAHIDMLIQDAQNKQTTALAKPRVNGKADFAYSNIVQSSFIDASTFPSSPGAPTPPKGTIIPIQFSLPYAGSAGITTSQVLFDGSVMVALQARTAVMDLARTNERITAENVKYGVYKAYNTLVIAYKQFDIIKGSLSLLRSMGNDIEKTKAAGFAEKIDVDRMNVQINNLATDSMKVANVLTVSEQVLKYNLGMDINTPIILTDTNIDKRSASAMELVAEKENYDRLPEFNALNTALKLNQYNLRRYQLSAIPSIAGFWSYGANYGSDKFSPMFSFDNYRVYSMFGLSVSAPIFEGFARQHKIHEARLSIEKTKNNIDNLKLGVDFQAAMARTNLKNSMLQIQSQKRNLELANSVLDLAQKKYKAGVGSNLEVTNAQTELLRAQNNYFAALSDMTNAEADLRKALGLLK